MITLTIATADDMESFGATLARLLRPGDVLALDGELGAGKTTLTRGLGEALGVRGTVASPTFVIARTHPRDGDVPLVHVDAYRLGSAGELADLDLDIGGSITVVEWAAGMVDAIADEWLSVRIHRPRGGDEDDSPRELVVMGHGERWDPLPEALLSLAP